MVEAGEGFGVFAGVFGVVEFEPVVEEAVDFGAGAWVGDEALGGAEDVGFFVEAVFSGGLEEAFVGDGIPEGEGESGGDGVVVGFVGVEEAWVEKVGGFEGEEDDAFDGEFGVGGGFELGGDELLLGIVEGAAEGHLGEGFGEGLEFGRAVRGIGLGAGEFVEVGVDVLCDGDGGLGGGLIPFFGDAGATFVTEAAIVGGKGGADDHDFGHALGGEVALGDDFLDAVRGFPEELQGGGFFAEFEVVDGEVVGSATDEVEGGAFFTDGFAGADPGVDEGFFAVVDGQAEAVFAADDEFVGAGFGGDEAAFEAEFEFVGIEFVFDGAIGAEVEVEGVDATVDFDGFFAGVGVAFEFGALLGFEDFRAAVEELEAAFFAPVFVAAVAEVADEVGDAGAILGDGEAGEVDGDGVEACLGGGGVEGVVDVGGDLFGVFADTGAGVLFGHGALDFFGQGFEGAVAGEGFVEFSGDAFAKVAVAAGALGFVDGGAWVRSVGAGGGGKGE